MYEQQIRTAPSTADLARILAEFHTRPIDEKFDSDDIIRPPSNQSAASSSSGMPSPSTAVAGAGGFGGAPPPPPPPRVPPRPPPPAQPRYVATYDYDNSVEDGMMSITAGEEFNVTDSSDADWWNATKLTGQNAGNSGWVPAAYLRKI